MSMNFQRSFRNLVPPFLLIASSCGLVLNRRTTPYTPSAVARVPAAEARPSPTRLFAAGGEPPNPFASVMGDLASSLLPRKSLATDAEWDASLAGGAVAPSWDDVRSRLEAAQTPAERRFRADLEGGYGEGSPLHKIRLYDASNEESDVRVTFYRDHASWCPYCQKVWFALEEKRIPYRVEKVNMNCYGSKPPEFLRLQPNGQIPVAVIDGRALRSSNSILAELESSFPGHKSLAPPDARRAQELFQLEGRLAGAWLGWLRSSGGGGGRAYMEDALAAVDRALGESGGPFFMGEEPTMVDVQFLSFLERACASLLYFKGFKIRVAPGEDTPYPGINRWFDALEERPSYQVTKSDYYTHSWDLPPQLGGCGAEPAGEPYRKAINGDGSSWRLPLEPHGGGVEPDWGPWAHGDNEAAARREAVERLSFNHEAIVRFAARGAGRKGMPPAMAALADPNATPEGAVVAGVDAALRAVASRMLVGDDGDGSLGASVRRRGSDGEEYSKALVASLAYLRDRIGVPRDMRLPAARQLRAHLNWAIDEIEKVSPP